MDGRISAARLGDIKLGSWFKVSLTSSKAMSLYSNASVTVHTKRYIY